MQKFMKQKRMFENLKLKITDFWDKKPCGTFGIIPEEPDAEYFAKIRERRYRLEPFIKNIANFTALKGKKVLEIGCGVGIDGLEFVKAGADYTGIDASARSLALAKQYFELSGYDSQNLILADVESLPFANETFDFIYSWGVLHHTPHIEKAVSEIHRVLKPNGEFCIMLYNRRSLVGFQLYIIYGLFRLRPAVSWRELFYKHHESLGTQAFTRRETMNLFGNFKDLKIEEVVTPYDLRIWRNVYLPNFFRIIVPQRFGFFRVIRGKNYK
jgi:ubiquinone/menaquinone biosynthesis C-methylase UbiE